MKNLIVIPTVLFIISFCCFVNYSHISKKEMMNSWAWKIFIFTDEGDFMPIESAQHNFQNSTKVKPIFVEDVFEIYNNDVSSLSDERELFKYPVVFAYYQEDGSKK